LPMAFYPVATANCGSSAGLLISPYGILGPNFSSCRIHPQQGELDDGEIGRAARASKTKSS
jgi:hypothetical protein